MGGIFMSTEADWETLRSHILGRRIDAALEVLERLKPEYEYGAMYGGDYAPNLAKDRQEAAAIVEQWHRGYVVKRTRAVPAGEWKTAYVPIWIDPVQDYPIESLE
jgi:hypothetical protein